MKKVLLLDNYDSFTYNLLHYIESSGDFEVFVFRNDQITLEEVANYDLIILSPGPGLPKDAGILLPLIKKYATSKKILGVCLGMQAIAEIFGATLKNLDSVYHGVATPIEIINANDVLFNGFPKTIQVGRYHSWVVAENSLPDSLQITSLDASGLLMSFTHTTYPIYGVQFHPESILTPFGKQLIANFLNS